MDESSIQCLGVGQTNEIDEIIYTDESAVIGITCIDEFTVLQFCEQELSMTLEDFYDIEGNLITNEYDREIECYSEIEKIAL